MATGLFELAGHVPAPNALKCSHCGLGEKTFRETQATCKNVLLITRDVLNHMRDEERQESRLEV